MFRLYIEGNEMQIFQMSESEFEEIKRRPPRGREAIYPFKKLKIGEAFYIDLKEYQDRNGKSRTYRDLRSALNSSARQYKPKRFSIMRRLDGFIALRMS